MPDNFNGIILESLVELLKEELDNLHEQQKQK